MGTVRPPFGGVRLRLLGVVLLDATATALSLLIALKLRIPGPIPDAMWSNATVSALAGAVVAICTFHLAGIYRQAWRYVSVKELLFLAEVSVLAVALSTIVTLVFFSETNWLPRSVPIIQWYVLIVMLISLRVARRAAREFLAARASDKGVLNNTRVVLEEGRNVLLIGDLDWAETELRTLQFSGQKLSVVGILAHDDRDRNLHIRGVPVLGTIDEFENVVGGLTPSKLRPDYVIISESDVCLTGPRIAKLTMRASQLGLEIVRALEPGRLQHSRGNDLDLGFLNLTDLIERSELRLDDTVVRHAVKGRRILVTGAGGTIGSELVRQIAALEAGEIVLVDHAEYNLYAIDLELRERFPMVKSTPLLCSIRQRNALKKAFCHHRPDLVFHAAALKHVPLVEANICSGILTNVIGTRNVADAVIACGARAMITVSTDKAVNPVGMMGAAKRLGELYCQALDLSIPDAPDACRFLTVRFGNVMGSSGSLIPLFLRQLSRRGPLTVTHPEIERYFMTVHEAVQLILHSSAATLQGGINRGRIFVLDMGKPIKIIDIARRVIRAAGLEPDVDVKIDIIGLRPGEKLFEELFDTSERRLPSTLPGIFEAEPRPIALAELEEIFERLEELAHRGDPDAICQVMRSVIDFHESKPAPVLALPAAEPVVAPPRVPALIEPARLVEAGR